MALPLTRKELVEAQREDPELVPLLSRAITSEKAKRESVCFYMDRGLLKRKWRKSQCWNRSLPADRLPKITEEDMENITENNTENDTANKKGDESGICHAPIASGDMDELEQ